jgi:hypothetical protein
VCSFCDHKRLDSPTAGNTNLELRQDARNVRKPLSDFSISKLTESENQKDNNQRNSYESYKVEQMSPYGYLTTSPFDNVHSSLSGMSPEAYINIVKRQAFTSGSYGVSSLENVQYMSHHYGRMFSDH